MSPSHFRSLRNIFIAVAIGGAVTLSTATAKADYLPQVPGFSDSYPWFNNVSQYQGNQSFQWFLANHPDIAGALARNPSLLYNAGWRSQFPALQQYLANHPYEWQALNGEDWSEGPVETQWGNYDDQHQWRDAYWWHLNNPNWFYDNHADWASLDSRWLNEDGAYDQQRQWHYGEWWYNQNPSWVASNHPNWLREHQNWEAPSEQRSYRQQHAMIQQNQQHQAVQRQDQHGQMQNQQNQRRAVDQRQANLQQQQTMRQQNQRQQNQQQRQATHQQQAAVEQHQHANSISQDRGQHQQHAQQQQGTHQQAQGRAGQQSSGHQHQSGGDNR